MRDGRMFSDSANETETAITLAVLNAVQENDKVTQRSLAQEIGVALGLANAYLKRCVKKGLIKVQQAPANRYLYYLTPKGFSEKSRLTAEYLGYSLQVFRQAREEYSQAIATCEANGWRRVALCGISELTEVALLSAIGSNVEVVGVVDTARTVNIFHHLPVEGSLDRLGLVDAVLLTCLSSAQESFDALARSFPAERILLPRLLRVVRAEPDEATPPTLEDVP